MKSLEISRSKLEIWSLVLAIIGFLCSYITIGNTPLTELLLTYLNIKTHVMFIAFILFPLSFCLGYKDKDKLWSILGRNISIIGFGLLIFNIIITALFRY